MLYDHSIQFADLKDLVKWTAHCHGLDCLLGAKVMLHPIFYGPAFGPTNMGSSPLSAILAVYLLHNRLVAIIDQQLGFTHASKIYWRRGTGSGDYPQHRDNGEFLHKIAQSFCVNSPYHNSLQPHGAATQPFPLSASF